MMKSGRLARLGALLATVALVSDCGARSSLLETESFAGLGGGGSSSTGSSGGADPCVAVTCDTPPPPTCVSATTLRASPSPGVCAEGGCTYDSADTTCPLGCSGGACVPATGPMMVSAGGAHTCAVTSTGALRCWGDNQFGALGSGSTTNSPVPINVPGLPSDVIDVSAGNEYTCAITSAGAVECWGDNGSGQLGNGSFAASLVPVFVTGLGAAAVAVSTGYTHTCAILTTGAVECWGLNVFGQLGNNTITDSPVPVDVIGLPAGAIAVSAGLSHTCALLSTGAVACWGDNHDGELGDNLQANSNVAVEVVGLSSGVAAVSAGLYSTCALTAAGAVKCWGNNAEGQLGNDSTTGSLIPVDVKGLSSGIAAISVGSGDACALTMTGAIMCWGGNGYGQLGNDSSILSTIPVKVEGVSSGVLAVSVGGAHTCAVTSIGGIVCWGQNDTGELGNNSTTTSPTPVEVVGF